jgi:hypothetical protein
VTDKQEKFLLIADLIGTTVRLERERCAKIAEDYAAECAKGSSVSSMAEDVWGETHGKLIAKLIRELK